MSRRTKRAWISAQVVPSSAALGLRLVPAAVEAARQDVDEKAADELVGGQGHNLLPVGTGAAVVLVAEGDAGLVEGVFSSLGKGVETMKAFSDAQKACPLRRSVAGRDQPGDLAVLVGLDLGAIPYSASRRRRLRHGQGGY